MKIELPETVDTERFVLKRVSMQDKDAWMEFMTSSEALNFISFIQEGEQGCVDWINRQLQRYQEGKGGLYGMYNNEGDLLGQCGLLVQEVDGKEELEIGYHVIPKYWKKGYAYEAASAWKYYAFQNRFCKSLISIIDVGNKASQAVALKNGMIPEKDASFKGLDVTIYRIKYSDWLFELDPDEICPI